MDLRTALIVSLLLFGAMFCFFLVRAFRSVMTYLQLWRKATPGRRFEVLPPNDPADHNPK